MKEIEREAVKKAEKMGAGFGSKKTTESVDEKSKDTQNVSNGGGSFRPGGALPSLSDEPLPNLTSNNNKIGGQM